MRQVVVAEEGRGCAHPVRAGPGGQRPPDVGQQPLLDGDPEPRDQALRGQAPAALAGDAVPDEDLRLGPAVPGPVRARLPQRLPAVPARAVDLHLPRPAARLRRLLHPAHLRPPLRRHARPGGRDPGPAGRPRVRPLRVHRRLSHRAARPLPRGDGQPAAPGGAASAAARASWACSATTTTATWWRPWRGWASGC